MHKKQLYCLIIFAFMFSLIGNGCSIGGKQEETPIEKTVKTEHEQSKDLVSKSPSRSDELVDVAENQNNSKQSSDDYILDIKGKSKQLSPIAWENMLKWRQDIVNFTKLNSETIFLNGPNKKQVALTFDDGPDNNITKAIVDVLKNYHVKGSFFFVGSKVEQYPEIVKYAFENNNLILSHSYTHEDLTTKSNANIMKSLVQTDNAIENVIGKRPALFRPPYGETDSTLVQLSKQYNYKIALWSIDTLDWSQKESTNIANNVIENVRNGDIILMHSDGDKSETVKALPIIIEELHKQGFEIVDLETLLQTHAYK